jgi:Flp pilus assembly protein TadG
MLRPPRHRSHGERGAILIWVAVLLIVILAFISLGVDGAKLMATRTQLQNAADAGALAGASMFDPATGKIVEADAIEKAQQVAGLNKAFIGTSELLINSDVTVTCFPPGSANRCSVYVTRTGGRAVITTLAQVVGGKTLNMDASATARISQPDSVCEVLVPFGAVPPGPGGFVTGCDSIYTLKLDDTASPGNYQLVDFPELQEGPCAGSNPPGGSTLRCYIANGYPGCVGIGEIADLTTEPGNKVGPVRQGLNDRFDGDYDKENICYSEYVSNGGTGQRVVNVPLVENFEVNGRKQVRVVGFSAFFLRNKTSNPTQKGVEAEFLYHVVPGSGQTGTGTGTLYTLRLIQ